MFPRNALIMLGGTLLALAHNSPAVAQTAPFPPSPVITGITFDMTSLKEFAPGSDNWAITWADDGHQYTTWGDGGGFGGDNVDGRVSMGIARVEGSKDNYLGINVNGGKNPESGNTNWSGVGTGGKSLGILSIDLSGHGGQAGTLYLYRNGTGSTGGAFDQTELYRSLDHGATWTYAGVRWEKAEFENSLAFFSPSFLQFGKDYSGARDEYVYSIAPQKTPGEGWEVQTPGMLIIFRVHKAQMENKASYEYFAGLTDGIPRWSTNLAERQPVFEDAVNGVMRSSISYNAPLGRYLLITQQVSRWYSDLDGKGDYHVGIYDAPEPWGPWTTVFFGSPRDDLSPPLNSGAKTVFWNFSNKWLSADGKNFVLVYTGDGPDNWGTVEGHFTTAPTDTSAPTVPQNLNGAAAGGFQIDLAWDASSDPESGIARYVVYRDGSPVGGPLATSFSDSGLSPSTTYTYRVSAVNGAGLESAQSAPVTVTTADLSPPDPPSGLRLE